MNLELTTYSAYVRPMDDTPQHAPASTRTGDAEPEHGPMEAPLHIAVVPGLLDKQLEVTREPGESDARYRSRCDLLAALLDYAKQQG